MKKKNNSISNVGDEEYEELEGEENRVCPHSIVIPFEEADRCPICLSYMLEKEVGFPENCNHIFCITCILKWAETLSSCPIDRKPFQAVYKFSALEGCIKVEIDPQLRETDEKKNECFFKKQDSCSVDIKSCMRKRAHVKKEVLSAKFYKDLKKMHRNTSNNEIMKRKATSIKINKTQRQNCPNHCFRNYFSSIFSSDNHTGESSCAFRGYCTGFTEVNEINSVISQKRQELQLSWFHDTLPGIARIGFIPWMAGAEILPLVSSMLPGTIFPMNTISLEDFGSPFKEHMLAHTQGGEEKRQTAGTSNSRGTRRKPAETTPRRRSTRNMKTETVSQPQNSPISNNSECDAPDSNKSSINLSTSADSKKQIRPGPKRKPKRRTRKTPVVKKKLRSSSSLPEKSSSSDSADDEVVESDTLPVLDKEYISNTERCNSCIIMQTDIEQESANDSGSFNEHANTEELKENCGKEQDSVKKLYSDSNSQEPSMVVQEEIKEIVNKGTEAEILYLENELSKNITEKIDEPIEPPAKTPEHLDFEVKASASLENPQNELHILSKSEGVVHHISFRDELFKSTKSKVNEDQLRESLKVNTLDHIDSEIKIVCVESSETEAFESAEVLPVDHTAESPKVELLDHIESIVEDCSGNEESTTDCSHNENFKSIQDNKNLLKDNFPPESDKLDKPLEEKSEFLTEENINTELPNLDIEQFPKHFNEDNNESIPMECDSFCSDQNESESELIVSAETKLEENSQDKIQDSDLVSEKSAKFTFSHETENSACSTDKAKKPRTRRSRFHSPSTTWLPNKDVRERKRSQSPSPKKDIRKESGKSHSQSPKMEITRGRRRSRSQSRSPKRDFARERKRSQSWSPKREEGRKSQSPSPRRDTLRENRRSRSRTKDSPSREKSRSRSRERENDRDGQRRDHLRERRARRWSRSRSRSRSCSRSRTKSNKASFSRNERDSYSPRWKDRWTNDNWRFPRGNDRYRKNEQDKQNENLKKEKTEVNPDIDEQCSSAEKHRNDCPDWIMERINSGPDPRTRNTDKFKDSHWEENRHDNSGKSWNKNFGSSWMSNRGRGNRGRGTFRAGFGHAEQNENRWQNRKPLSGNSNSSGNDSSKFAEQQPYRRKNEQEFSFDTPADRSGWTSASSWAIRKTLPADVQNYYSRRGRNSSGPQSGWMRQEEEISDHDQNLKDQTNQQGDGTQLPITMMPQQMNVMQHQMNAQHQTMNIFPYPVGVHAPLMNIQRNPFNIHPQLPMHLHAGVPLMQVAAPSNVSQGLPPPPPPPPPSQQVNCIASQPDGKQSQGIPSASHVGNNMSTPVLPTSAATPGNMGPFQGPSSGNASSSSHSKAPNAAVKLAESKVSVTVEASADSSKTDKKLQIQEKAAQEVKLAIKPFYQNKDITKEEYKEIVRKAVDKVCHSKSGEVNSAKVANLVKAYVDKYKHSRKGSQKKNPEEPASTEKKIG